MSTEASAKAFLQNYTDQDALRLQFISWLLAGLFSVSFCVWNNRFLLGSRFLLSEVGLDFCPYF